MIRKIKELWGNYKAELGAASNHFVRSSLMAILVVPFVFAFIVFLLFITSDSDLRRIKDFFNPNEIKVEAINPLNLNLVSVYWNTEDIETKTLLYNNGQDLGIRFKE